MRRKIPNTVFILALALLTFSVVAEPPKNWSTELTSVRTAMEWVESSNNPNAVNKSEDAVGILQIRPVMVAEVNRILAGRKDTRRYTLADRYSPVKSREMFGIYTDYWCKHRDIYTAEYVAKVWNGGPGGPNNPRTEVYWQKVRRKMDSTK